MIVHSANNLRKEKKKKKNKRGNKRNSIEPHAITMIWSIPFKHG